MDVTMIGLKKVVIAVAEHAEGYRADAGRVDGTTHVVIRAGREDAVRDCMNAVRSDVSGPIHFKLPYIGKSFDIPWWDQPKFRQPPAPAPDEELKLPSADVEDGEDGSLPVELTRTMEAAS